MPVDSQHDDYKFNAPDWRKCRDTISGEKSVIAGGEMYLPIPPGMAASQTTQTDLNTKTTIRSKSDRYEHYKSFATFPEVIGPQVNGIQGLIHSTELTVELPKSMEYLYENATPDGMTLPALWEYVTREILSTGRLNLLGEVMPEADEIRICTYVVESLINWRFGERNIGSPLELAVLEEIESEPDEKDHFLQEPVYRWRELAVDESGNYQVRKWIRRGNTKDPEIEIDESGEEWIVPEFRGKRFESIPLWPINAVDTGFHYGPIPIMPTVRRALQVYRLTADYYRALHIKGDPQPCVFGIRDAKEVPTSIGGQQIWTFSNPAGHAEYLDIDGGGIPATAEAIADQYERMSAENGRLIDTQRKTTAESGAAMRQRQAFQLVTVTSLVVNAATAVEQVLRAIGLQMGVSPADVEKIKATPDLAFADADMGFDELLQAMQAVALGAPLLEEELRETMVARRMVNTPFDEYVDKKSTQGPLMPELPRLIEGGEEDGAEEGDET